MEKIDFAAKENIKRLLLEYNNPKKRKAISSIIPFLKKIIIPTKRGIRKSSNFLNFNIARKKGEFFSNVIARHQSVLRRKLGDTDMCLQEGKVENLKIAIKKMDGLIIYPNKIFSLWNAVGKISASKGYQKGMFLSNGKVIEGIGGGLCQLSNFLFWIFLHTDVEIIERYHHSLDVFPDSGRVLPFGSGATILYNFIDLKFKNISKNPVQIKIWLTNTHLKGQILSSERSEYKYNIVEKNHCFIKNQDKYFRYNELWRQKKLNGKTVEDKKIITNFAPVLYEVTDKYLKDRNHTLLLIDRL